MMDELTAARAALTRAQYERDVAREECSEAKAIAQQAQRERERASGLAVGL